ncbi:MAG: hypothetical protein ACE14M_11705 [Terriglobales bacterium]
MENTDWKRVKLGHRALAAIFLVGYLFISLMALEQSRIIASQRELIHQLFQDSLDLNAMRLHHAAREKR